MKCQIGDILIFTGNIDNEKHYSNFEVGRQYKVESIQKVQYDIDEISGYNEECILFESHGFGALKINAEKYFKSITEQRDNRIKQIID